MTSHISPAESLLASRLPEKEATASRKTPEAAKEFEALLMCQMFQTLRKTVEPSGLLGDSGHGQETYHYLLDQAVVGHAMQTGKGWGLAERIQGCWAENAAIKKH